MNGSLADPILPHTTVWIAREHLCSFEILVKLHLTELEFVVLGHTQFEALIKYCTADKLVEMESHVKVSSSMLISESVIFDSGKNLQKIICNNCITGKYYAYLPDGVSICLLQTICPLSFAHSIVLPIKSSLKVTRSCEMKDLFATETLRPTSGCLIPHFLVQYLYKINLIYCSK